MPKDHARKKVLADLKDLGIKRAFAIALHDHPDAGRAGAPRRVPGDVRAAQWRLGFIRQPRAGIWAPRLAVFPLPPGGRRPAAL